MPMLFYDRKMKFKKKHLKRLHLNHSLVSLFYFKSVCKSCKSVRFERRVKDLYIVCSK